MALLYLYRYAPMRVSARMLDMTWYVEHPYRITDYDARGGRGHAQDMGSVTV